MGWVRGRSNREEIDRACRLCLERRIADFLSSFPVAGRLLGGECKLVHLTNQCLFPCVPIWLKWAMRSATKCEHLVFQSLSIPLPSVWSDQREGTAPKPYKLTRLQTKIASIFSWSRLMPADTQPCWMGSESDAETNKWSLPILISRRATDIIGKSSLSTLSVSDSISPWIPEFKFQIHSIRHCWLSKQVTP